MPDMPGPLLRFLLCLLLAGAAVPAAAEPHLPAAWPAPERLSEMQGDAITFPSRSPYTLAEADSAPAESGVGRLFLPPEATAAAPVPAVILLHGAGGVISTREPTYARQLASLGVAALVVDSFAARRDRAAGFVERLLEITEVMLVADAYAALAYLDSRPEIDAGRTALIGFSYGGMASVFAAYAQVAEALAPPGLRFAGHVAFYAPCIARFSRTETTGAPVLMLWGDGDAIVDGARCAEIAEDLRAGGSSVERKVYAGAFHQWDGRFGRPRPIGRNLAPCRYRVDAEGVAWDRNTFLPLLNRLLRQTSLALCSDPEGYMIGRDDAVRARATADLAAFLERILAPPR